MKRFILVFIIVFLIVGTVEKAFTASLVPEIPYTLYVNPSVAYSLSSHAGAYILFKYLDDQQRERVRKQKITTVDLVTGKVDFDQPSATENVLPVPQSQIQSSLYPFPLLSESPWPPNADPTSEHWSYCFIGCEEPYYDWYGGTSPACKYRYQGYELYRSDRAVREIDGQRQLRVMWCEQPDGTRILQEITYLQFLVRNLVAEPVPVAEFTYDPASDTFTGVLPDGTSVTFYGTPQPQCIDNDGDGHYARTATCPQGDDCNDTVYDPTVYYEAPELCDGKDNNCDGQVDEGLSTDTDGDGHYTPNSCKKPNDDCDDNEPTIYPGDIEVCDGKDNDCNGQVDEGCEQCIDNDRDGYYGYNPATCPQGDDCNDNDPTIYPGATEICDGKDNNCNGQTDERFLLGIPCSVGIGECERDGITICSLDGTGTVCSATPGDPSPEVCDGKDNNCNGIIDDLPPRTCYTGPAGTEGVGICKAGTQVCENGTWSTCIGEVTPQEEKCDGLDNNCNGQTDEGCCEVSVRVSPSEVWPQRTGGKTGADVVVTLSKPAPPGGCTVDLKVYPVPYSGGHKHHDVSRPKGTVDPNNISFSEGEIGIKSAKYTSSEVAGTGEHKNKG